MQVTFILMKDLESKLVFWYNQLYSGNLHRKFQVDCSLRVEMAAILSKKMVIFSVSFKKDPTLSVKNPTKYIS